MEKRVILAFALSIIVMYAFSVLRPQTPVQQPPANVATPAPEAAKSVEKSEAPVPQPPEAAPANEVKAEKAQDFVFNTPLYTATVSNAGGVLKSFKLKAYSDGEGRPLELINEAAGAKVGWPLAVVTADKAIDEQLSKADFVGRADDDRLILEFASNGLHARKILQFDRENYEFTLETSLTKDGVSLPHSVVWQGRFGDQSIPQDPAKQNAVHQVDAAFKRVALRSMKDPQDFTTLRAGVEDQYFLAIFLSPDNPTAVKVRKQEYPGADGKPIPTLAVSAAASGATAFRVYVGPKQREWLGKGDPQLASVIDYGWFEFIARPLVAALLWIHSYIGNFGWSIIILTIVLNFVLFPLRLKQQTSMLKMQKIQPQMKRLQDQYKKLKPTDPKRPEVQAEMMGLYKQHGVNPMGGCLPLLLQMPLLFGFYSALSYSIELRRAPWILWIKDLSQYDPYYVIPILMAVAMIIQQKLTPTANVDPAQAKMMMIMPLMFTFMFLWYSSGLALYWLTSNVLGIVQQGFINKYWSPQAEGKLRTRARPGEPRGA